MQYPRLFVIQPSHTRRNAQLIPGQWAVKIPVEHTDGDQELLLGESLRLTILSRRSLAIESVMLHDGQPESERQPERRYYSVFSTEFQRVQELSESRQPIDGVLNLVGTELLTYLHGGAWAGFATYFASSRTARTALTCVMEDMDAEQEPGSHQWQVSLEHRATRSFQWYTPKWTPLRSRWVARQQHADKVADFRNPCQSMSIA